MGEAEWLEIDIHQCLESTLNELSHEIRPKADVTKEYGEVPQIRRLPFQINQVLLNLLMNAAHAFEQRGTITTTTGHHAGMVWARIADTGCGIDPAHVKRIFDPFFTTRPVGAGTGLGLSTSYGIVQQHGGTIDAASEVGVGTTITVRLPVLGTDSARVPIH
ncbi:MAG: ATP-binding protein [Pseudomonadota bacterium]|nr:ATP-binding protein [Pseudomonadota bacterium]